MLGAGPAGLMAALRAARAGHHCRVLEASGRVGGMAASIEVAGQSVDLGSHRLHPAASPDVLDLLSDLLGPDLQTRARNGRLRFADRWVGFPLRTGELLRTLPPALTARLVVDSVATTAQRRGHDRPDSFAAEIEARLGPTVADAFYRPYARKLYGLDPEDLDAELARRRVSVGSPIDLARRLVRARRPAGRTFLYPRRGYGQIVDRLATAACDAGATIELDQPVEAVRVGADGVEVATPTGRAGGDVALSTIPIGRLATALAPTPPAEITAALARRRTRAILLVYLVVDRPRYTPFDAHYLPGPETPVARLSEPKNYRDGDDRPDHTVLCAEIPCWPDDELTGWSSDDLGSLVVDGLDRVGLPAVRPAEVEIQTLPSVYPVLDRQGAADRAAIDDWAAGIDRVLPLGRQGLGVIDNLHHVLAMGAAAADAIDADGSILGQRWARSLASFADHVVED